MDDLYRSSSPSASYRKDPSSSVNLHRSQSEAQANRHSFLRSAESTKCMRPSSMRQCIELAQHISTERESEDLQDVMNRISAASKDDNDEDPQVMEEGSLKSRFQRVAKLAMHWLPAHAGPKRGFSLSEIDAFLGRSRPPAIELLVVEVIVTRNPFNLSHFGRWAHSAIRYTLPTGEQKLVNICRPGRGKELIEFYDDPEDYIFGVNGKGGIFSRDMASVRIEEVNDASILAMHHYFLSTSNRFRSDGRGVKFQLTGGFWHNIVRSLFRMSSRPSGNCARWVSRGLVYANVLKRPTMFPKAIWKELVEDQTALNASNVNVVYYNRIAAKKKQKPFLKTGFSFLNVRACFAFPSDFLQNLIYWDLRKFANVVVENSPDFTLEEQTEQLQCTTRAGKRYRLSPWSIFGFAILRVLTVLVVIGIFLFYCPDATGLAHDGYCVNTWPKSIGERLILAGVFVGVFEFWFY